MIAMMIETNLRRQSKTRMKHVGLLKKNCNARLNSNKTRKQNKEQWRKCSKIGKKFLAKGVITCKKS